MSYRIRPDRAFDGEVHKAAAHQLSKAMAALTDRPQGLHEAVRAARKGIKRLWALYRLIAPVATCAEAREALKEIAFDCGRRDTARLFQKSWRKNVRLILEPVEGRG